MKKILVVLMLVVFALSLMAQTAAPAAPKTDAKTCACCADKAKCEACCKNGCKDCKECKDGAQCCCKGKDGQMAGMACMRDKNGKMDMSKDGTMSCCKGMKDAKMAKNGCCSGKCDRMNHEKKAGM